MATPRRWLIAVLTITMLVIVMLKLTRAEVCSHLPTDNLPTACRD